MTNRPVGFRPSIFHAQSFCQQPLVPNDGNALQNAAYQFLLFRVPTDRLLSQKISTPDAPSVQKNPRIGSLFIAPQQVAPLTLC